MCFMCKDDLKNYSDIISIDNNGRVVCLDCYYQQLDDSVEFFENDNIMGDFKTHNKMKEILRDKGWVVNEQKISNIEMLDLYESLITQKSIDRFKDNAQLVRFPMHNPNSMNDIIEVVIEINFNNGGSFIADKDMELNMIVDIINIIATYVNFGGNKYVNFDDDLFMAVPKNIIEFANNSRIDSGYRLLERCLRHSFYTKTKDLRSAAVKLTKKKDSGQLGFLFSHNIYASMKDQCKKW